MEIKHAKEMREELGWMVNELGLILLKVFAGFVDLDFVRVWVVWDLLRLVVKQKAFWELLAWELR